MQRSFVPILVIVAAIGSWIFFNPSPFGDQPNTNGDWDIPVPTTSRTPERGVFTPSNAGGQAAGRPARQTIRIATFNLHIFGPTKASKPHVMEILAQICRSFDIVAIQEVRSRDQTVVPQLVDEINLSGAHYDHVIGPRTGRTPQWQEQLGFIFNRETVEVDRFHMYSVDDPFDVMHRDPFVAWFRTIGPAVDEAFTFTLVNFHTDPDDARRENSVLDGIARSVRDDGREEDDVILVGDFNLSANQLRELLPKAGIEWAVASSVATNTRGTAQYDNLGYSMPFTDEFTGRAGVLDLVREYNFTVDQALEISDHVPAWAEFGVFEGGTPGHVAESPAETQRR